MTVPPLSGAGAGVTGTSEPPLSGAGLGTAESPSVVVSVSSRVVEVSSSRVVGATGATGSVPVGSSSPPPARAAITTIRKIAAARPATSRRRM